MHVTYRILLVPGRLRVLTLGLMLISQLGPAGCESCFSEVLIVPSVLRRSVGAGCRVPRTVTKTTCTRSISIVGCLDVHDQSASMVTQ